MILTKFLTRPISHIFSSKIDPETSDNGGPLPDDPKNVVPAKPVTASAASDAAAAKLVATASAAAERRRERAKAAREAKAAEDTVTDNAEKTHTDLGSESINSLAEFSKELESKPDAFVFSTTPEDDTPLDRFSEKVAESIVLDFAKRTRCRFSQAMAGIAKLIQDGGANASKQNLKRTVGDIVFDIVDLRAVITVNSSNGTVRKLAKSLRNSIAALAERNDWKGPLYKDLQRSNPTLEITPTEAVYCNEIHSDNYDPLVPARIREALQRREFEIRKKNSEAPKKKKIGNKKKKK